MCNTHFQILVGRQGERCDMGGTDRSSVEIQAHQIIS